VKEITFQGATIPFERRDVDDGEGKNANALKDSGMDSTPKKDKVADNAMEDYSSPSPVPDRLRKIADAKETKRKRQDEQAAKMILRCAKFAKSTGAEVGAVVRVGNDKRDIQNPCSAIGVIFEMAEAGGILVCTQWGVLVSGQKRRHYWVQCDRYEVIAKADDEHAGYTISPELDRIRLDILSRKFDANNHKSVTLQQEQKRYIGSSPVRATIGCKCGKGNHGKKSCTSKCGCIAMGTIIGRGITMQYNICKSEIEREERS
jgi:hypothetical protein